MGFGRGIVIVIMLRQSAALFIATTDHCAAFDCAPWLKAL
jgi:hypothetical protein